MITAAVIVCVFFFSLRVNAQLKPVSVKDSVLLAGLVQIEYGACMPTADLADRFGFHSSMGMSIMIKNRSNWLFAGNSQFLFGNTIREPGVLEGLLTDNGALIGWDGLLYSPNMFLRGFAFSADFGKLIEWPGPNPNSGIFILAGAGFMQHKISFDADPDLLPQLSRENRKGYDRLSNGPLLHQYLGYQFLGHKAFVNFRFGVDFTQAFTKSRRSFNADDGHPNPETRKDLDVAFKFAWTLPIYEKPKTRFFYR